MAKTPRTWTGARTPSGLKRVRQAQSRHEVLQPRRSAAKTYVAKALAVAAAPGDSTADPMAALAEALSALDRAAKAGAIHRNAAARRKSRLTRKVNAALSGTQVQAGGHVTKSTGKMAAQKAAKARIAAGKAGKAKGAQTAAGKARAALSKTARAEAAAAKAAEASAAAHAAPAKASATKTGPATRSKASGAKTSGAEEGQRRRRPRRRRRRRRRRPRARPRPPRRRPRRRPRRPRRPPPRSSRGRASAHERRPGHRPGRSDSQARVGGASRGCTFDTAERATSGSEKPLAHGGRPRGRSRLRGLWFRAEGPVERATDKTPDRRQREDGSRRPELLAPVKGGERRGVGHTDGRHLRPASGVDVSPVDAIRAGLTGQRPTQTRDPDSRCRRRRTAP